MPNDHYTRVALNENDAEGGNIEVSEPNMTKYSLKYSLGIFAVVLGVFGIGFFGGKTWSTVLKSRMVTEEDGLLPPQSFIPKIPTKEVVFNFPTDFEDTGPLGDKLWNDMMPLGSGFLRVPYPRKYDMPPSKKISGDPEEAEIYSMSMTHQLHCLGVIRHVIMEYEKGSKSRFAGDGHEYHCLDYIRQAVLCAGDTTLDHAAISKDTDVSERRSGFTGANSTHECRDWDTIKTFLTSHRSSDKTGILI